ncbi:MAG: 50S ribosomal protein L3 [Candidatus Paceibacterota bacterium]
MKFLLGTKEYMTQLFTEQGEMVPVTILRAGPGVVTQVKGAERDGYTAVQIGFGRRKAHTVTSPVRGHTKAALEAVGEDPSAKGFRWLREFRSDDGGSMAVGDALDVSLFSVGDSVHISGITKGKGFQGGVKRHGFSGAPKSHGTKHAHREVGSIGATGPQRVFKGRKMPGRMGTNRVTVKNLDVVYVDPAQQVIGVKGAVPGPRGCLVEIQGTK